MTNEPLLIVRAGLSSPRQLMDEYTPEQVLAWLLWYREARPAASNNPQAT